METKVTSLYTPDPTLLSVHYVPDDHKYMCLARDWARDHATDLRHPTGAVIVSDRGRPLAYGANQSAFSVKFLNESHPSWCLRDLLHVGSGKMYWLCPGCASPRSHAEQRAVSDIIHGNIDAVGADLYLWGHWWACRSCCDAMIAVGIRRLFLVENSAPLAP